MKTRDFNPRSPYGERPGKLELYIYGDVISIHAPLTGSDAVYTRFSSKLKTFQSTLPLRGATNIPPPDKRREEISIHAPLTGSD